MTTYVNDYCVIDWFGVSCPGIFTPDGYLPPNMKIVSNFFRTGPDGLVNGFTTPIIHELNW